MQTPIPKPSKRNVVFIYGIIAVFVLLIAITSISTDSSIAQFAKSSKPVQTRSTQQDLRLEKLNEYLIAPRNISFTNDFCTQTYNNGNAFLEPPIKVLRYATRSHFLLDIGGHHGKTTFGPISCLSIMHRVITVEPVQSNIKRLRETAHHLGIAEPSYSWQLIPAAFSNETKTTEIYIPGETSNSALSPNAATFHVKGPSYPQTVQLLRGDDIIFDAGLRPDMIKLDVQGVEYLAMLGMDKLLSENRDMLVMAENDWGFASQHNLDPMDPYRFMTKRNFKAFCDADVIVKDGEFYPKNMSAEIRLENMASRTEPCPDYYFFKNTQPYPGA